jgi:hypothetical protein
MTTDEPIAFIDYWDAIDAALLKFFAIDTCDARIGSDWIAAAQEEGQTPEEFALWIGQERGLQTGAEARGRDRLI